MNHLGERFEQRFILGGLEIFSNFSRNAFQLKPNGQLKIS